MAGENVSSSLGVGAAIATAAAVLAVSMAAGRHQTLRARSGGSSWAVVAAAVTAAAAAAIAALRFKRGKATDAFARYPQQYVARRGTPSVIDGDVYKQPWSSVPWSEPFIEIRGVDDASPGSGPNELQTTRMKMLWDDECLYVAAVMDVAAGDELVAKFTARNSPIFHTDSDFEVFVDPAGCCHGYKELEMNALNTVWNLMLNRPYMDGGGELSGRVAKEGEAAHWDVKNQRTAARVTRGKLHQPAEAAQWCVEIALSHADMLSRSPIDGPNPAAGRSWRINFSRVEKKGHVNWVWSPQVIWSPKKRCYSGEVNMHLPDAWGYVVFADAEGRLPDHSPADAWRDPAWPVRHAAAVLYYAVRAFREEKGSIPPSVAELREAGLLPESELAGLDISIHPVDAEYAVDVVGGGWAAHITQDRLLTVQRHN